MQIEYVRGNFYRTSDGDKAELIWMDSECVQMLFIRLSNRTIFWLRNPQGLGYIVGPWRDPAKVCVRMYQHKNTGQVRVWDEFSFQPPATVASEWELLGGWTLTEGIENAPT